MVGGNRGRSALVRGRCLGGLGVHLVGCGRAIVDRVRFWSVEVAWDRGLWSGVSTGQANAPYRRFDGDHRWRTFRRDTGATTDHVRAAISRPSARRLGDGLWSEGDAHCGLWTATVLARA